MYIFKYQPFPICFKAYVGCFADMYLAVCSAILQYITWTLDMTFPFIQTYVNSTMLMSLSDLMVKDMVTGN